jgi:hypothetical protein
VRRRRTVRALALTIVFLAAACGDDDVRDTQPSPDSTGFTDGAFDELPRHPRSDEVGSRSEKDGVVAQSFEVRNATPQQILEWYTERLEGWSMIGTVDAVGEQAVRGRRARGDEELTISATSAPTLAEGDEAVSQYSLSLDTE